MKVGMLDKSEAAPVRRGGTGVGRGAATGRFGLLGMVLAVLGALVATGRPAAAQDRETILVFEHTGAASMLTSEKDKALKDAFGMLSARLRELPREIPNMEDFPQPVLDLILDTIAKPMRMAVTYNHKVQEEVGFGGGIVLSIGPMPQAEAQTMQGTISALMKDAPLENPPVASTKYATMSEAETPVGILRFGPRQAKDGWRYEIHFGDAPDPDTAFDDLTKPAAGMKATARGSLDLSALQPLAEMFVGAMGEEQGAELLKQLERMGLIGEHAVKYSFVDGFAKGGRHSLLVAEGMKKHADPNGMVTTPLTESLLRAIPADAYVCSVKRVTMKPAMTMLNELFSKAPEAGEFFENFRQETGVDLMNDVLGSFGETFAVYASETTGAGMTGGIYLAEVKDKAKLEGALVKLTGMANQMAAEKAKGYVRFRAWNDGSTSIHSLTFPGLPVPLEISLAFEGNWLIAGLTPQAVVAAARQVRDPKLPGIGSNKAIAAAIPKDGTLQSITYIDNAGLMRDGYQWITLLGSALANASRSPTDSKREPGLIIPPLPALRDGARPTITVGYWRGDDLVTETTGDESVLVSFTGAAGAIGPFIPVIAAGVGAAAAAFQARGMGMDMGMMLQFFETVKVLF